MIDLHCHALPDGEDGPADEAEGLELLRRLGADGVDTVAITPYIRDGEPPEKAAQTRERIAALRAAARGDSAMPALLPGAEVDLGWAQDAPEDALRQATYGALGKTLLIRTPPHDVARSFDDDLVNLTMRGYRIVLAHPEHSASYQAAPARLARLVAAGLLIQIAAPSLMAARGDRSGRLARALLQESMAHVIASNAHGLGGDGPRLADAVKIAENAVGARARWMVTDAPAAILAGAALPPAPSR